MLCFPVNIETLRHPVPNTDSKQKNITVVHCMTNIGLKTEIA